MRSKTLVIPLLALLFLAGAYWLLSQRASPPEHRVEEQRLFPRLATQLNDIERIRVEHGGNLYDVVKTAEHWQLPDKGGYPVLFERIKPLLLDITLLEIVEAKTDKAENYARLGVQAPSKKSDNTRLSLYAGAPAPVASLIVGGVRTGLMAGARDGIYIRLSGERRAWLVAGHLDVPQQPVDWVDRRIIHLKPKRVHRLTITHPDGDTLVIEKPYQGAPDYTVRNAPEGLVAKHHAQINPLARGLAALKMDDMLVRADAGLPQAEAVTAVFETWDGLRITAYTVEWNNAMFVWFDVAGAARDAPDQPPEDAQLDNDLHDRLEGWLFRIPRARGATLRARLTELMEPAP